VVSENLEILLNGCILHNVGREDNRGGEWCHKWCRELAKVKPAGMEWSERSKSKGDRKNVQK